MHSQLPALHLLVNKRLYVVVNHVSFVPVLACMQALANFALLNPSQSEADAKERARQTTPQSRASKAECWTAIKQAQGKKAATAR